MPSAKDRRKRARAEQRPSVIDPNQLYSIDEAGAALGISRALIYRRIRDGTLAIVKDGNRSLFKGSEIIRAAGGDPKVAISISQSPAIRGEGVDLEPLAAAADQLGQLLIQLAKAARDSKD